METPQASDLTAFIDATSDDGGGKHPKGKAASIQTPGATPVVPSVVAPDKVAPNKSNLGDFMDKVARKSPGNPYHAESDNPGVDINKFPDQMKAEANNENLRAQNQGNLSKAFNAAVGGIAGGFLGAGKNISYLLDPSDSLNAITGVDSLSSNWAADLATKGQTAIDDAFPIYKENNGNPLSGDSGNVFNGIKSLLSATIEFGLPGAGISAVVAAGVDAVELTSLTNSLLEYAAKSGDTEALMSNLGQRAAKVANYLQGGYIQDAAKEIGSGFLNNVMMGKVLGLQSYENVKQKLQHEVDAGTMSAEDAEKAAVSAGDDVELYNKMFLASDMIGLRALFTVKSGIRNSIEKELQGIAGQGLKVENAAIDTAVQSAKDSQKGFGHMMRESFGSSLNSTGEMVGQSLVQKEAEYSEQKVYGKQDKDLAIDMGTRWKDWIETKDTVVQGLMGVLGGPLGFGLTSILAGKGGRAAREAGLDAQGKIMKDNLEAVKTTLGSLVRGVHMKESRSKEDDPEGAKLAGNMAFTVLASANFANGTTDHLRALIKDVINMTPEQAKDRGMDDDYKQQALDLHEDLGTMEKTWLRSSQYADKVGMFGAEQDVRLTVGLIHHADIHLIPKALEDMQTQYDADLATESANELKRRFPNMPKTPLEALSPEFIESLPEAEKAPYREHVVPWLDKLTEVHSLLTTHRGILKDKLAITKAKIIEMKTKKYQDDFIQGQKDSIKGIDKMNKEASAKAKRDAAKDKTKKKGKGEETPAEGEGSESGNAEDDPSLNGGDAAPKPDFVPHVKAEAGELSPMGEDVLNNLTEGGRKPVEHSTLKVSEVAAHMPGNELNAKALHEEIVDHLKAKQERNQALGDTSRLSPAVKHTLDNIQKEKGLHLKATDVTLADVEKHMPESQEAQPIHDIIQKHLGDRDWAATHGPQEAFKEGDKVHYQDKEGKTRVGTVSLVGTKKVHSVVPEGSKTKVQVREARMAHYKEVPKDTPGTKKSTPGSRDQERIDKGKENGEIYIERADGHPVKATKPSWIGESIKKLLKGKSVKELREALKEENKEATLKWIADNSRNGTAKQNEAVLKGLGVHLDGIDAENAYRMEAYDRAKQNQEGGQDVEVPDEVVDENDTDQSSTGEDDVPQEADLFAGNGPDTDPDKSGGSGGSQEVAFVTHTLTVTNLLGASGTTSETTEQASERAAKTAADQKAEADRVAALALADFGAAMASKKVPGAPIEFNLKYGASDDGRVSGRAGPKHHLALDTFKVGDSYEIRETSTGLAAFQGGKLMGFIPEANRREIQELMKDGKKVFVKVLTVGDGKLIDGPLIGDQIGKVSERFPNPALKVATVHLGELSVDGKPFEGNVAEYGDPKRLGAYALIPVGIGPDGKLIYLPRWVSKDKIENNPQVLESLLLATRIWGHSARAEGAPDILRPGDQVIGPDGMTLAERFQKHIHDSLGFDITSNIGLREYYERFLYNINTQEHERTASARSKKAEDLGIKVNKENPLLTHLNAVEADDGVHAISISGNTIRFGQGGGAMDKWDGRNRANVYEFSPGEHDTPITPGGLTYGQKLEAHLKETYFHIHEKTAAQGENYTVPVLDKEGNVTDINKNGTYLDFVKSFTNTQHGSYTLPNGDSVYTHARTVSLRVEKREDTETPLEKVRTATKKVAKVKKEAEEKLSKRAAAVHKAGKESVQAIMNFPTENGTGVGHPAASAIAEELADAGLLDRTGDGKTPNATGYKTPEDPKITKAREDSEASSNYNPFSTPVKPKTGVQTAIEKQQTPGIPAPLHQELITMIAQDLWMKAARDGSKAVDIASELADWKKYMTERRDNLQGVIDSASDLGKIAMYQRHMDYHDAIIDNWEQVKSFALRELELTAGVVVRGHLPIEGTLEYMIHLSDHQGAPTDTIEAQNERDPGQPVLMMGDADSDSNGIDSNFDDSAKLQQDGKLGPSGRLRAYLGYVPDYFIDADGKPQVVKNFFQMPKNIGFDRSYNEIVSALSGVGGVFEKQMARLRELVNAKPYFADLIRMLEDAPDQVKYEFASAFNKENINMKGVVHSTANGITKTWIISAEATTRQDHVLAVWKSTSNAFGVFDSTDAVRITDSPRFVINKEKQDAAVNAYQALNAQFKAGGDTPKFREDFASWMKSIGVELSPGTVKDLFDNGLRIGTKSKLSPEKLMNANNKNSPISALYKHILGIRGQDELNSDDLLKPMPVKSLAALEAKYSPALMSSTGRSGGKTIPMDHFGRPTSNRTNELKEVRTLVSHMLFDPYASKSTWLGQLVRRADNDFPDGNGVEVKKGDFLDTDGNKLQVGGNPDILTESQFYREFTSGTGALQILKKSGRPDDDQSSMLQLDPLGQEMTRAGFLFDEISDSNDSQRYGMFLHPTMSDKATILHIRSTMNNFGLDLHTGRVKAEGVTKLFHLMVQSEIDRITVASAKIKAGETVHQAGFDQGRLMFFHMPGFNEMEDIWHDKGKGELRHANEEHTPAIPEERDQNGVITKEAVPAVTVGEVMKQRFGDMLEKIIDQKVEQWKKLGIIDTRDSKEYAKDENNVTKRDRNGMAIYKKVTELRYLNSEYVAGAKSRNGKNHIRHAAADFELNSMEANVNSFMLYNGDIAQFFNPDKPTVQDTWDNAIKRFASDMALAQKQGHLTSADSNAVYRQLHMKDVHLDSKIMDHIRVLYKDHPEKIKAYEQINTADGQEYVTLGEHLENMVGKGRMTDAHRKELLAKDEVYGLKTNDWDAILGLVTTAEKPVTAGSQSDDETGGQRKIFIKTSSFPLTKTVTHGMELDNLRQFMEDNKIHRATFESGWKVGAPKDKLTVHNTDGSVRTVAQMQEDYNEAAHSLEIKRDLNGYQQAMPVDIEKDLISRITQIAAQAFTNIQDLKDFNYLNQDGSKMSGVELKARYDQTYGELFRILSDRMNESMEVDENGVPNMERVQERMMREAISRDWGTNEKEALELVNKGVIGLGGKELVMPLFAKTDNKVEAMLQALITKGIVKFKMPGSSGVLLSEFGFRGSSPEMVYPDGRDVHGVETLPGYDPVKGLLPMRPDPVTGEILPAQVFLPYRWKALMEHLTRVERGENPEGDAHEGDPLHKGSISPSVLTMFGVRIPSQGPNSSVAMQCVGFLPESAVNNIVAPADFITQMGSDFDVDKLYMYQYHNQLGGMVDGKWDPRVVRYSGEDRFKLAQNELIDMHLAIALHTGNQEFIKTPNSTASLKKLANSMVALRSKGQPSPWDFNGTTSMYQSEQLQAAAAGKTGLSVYSRDSVFIANAQKKGLVIKTLDHLGNATPMRIKFGEHESKGELYPERTTGGKGYVSDQNSSIQSAAADNVKDPILSKLHINETTMPIDRALIAMGHEEEVRYAFLNQPIIRDYVERLVSNQSPLKMLGNAAYEITMKEMVNAYPASFVDSKGYTDTYDDRTGKGVRESERFGELSAAQMNKIISGETTEGNYPNYNLSQRAFLSKFLMLKGAGELISDAEGIVGVASSGLKSSALESYIQESKLAGLRSMTKGRVGLDGAEKILGEYRYSMEDRMGGEPDYLGRPVLIHQELADQGYHTLSRDADHALHFKPETYAGHATMEGLIKGNALWRKSGLFVYDSPMYKDVMDMARALTRGHDQSTTKEIEMQTYVMRAWKSMLYSTPDIGFGSHSGDSRRRLFMDNKETGSQSVATELLGYKDAQWLNMNGLLKRITPVIGPEGKPSLMQMIDGGGSSFDKDVAYQGYLDLIQFPRVIDTSTGRTTADLARDIASAGFLAGGNQGYTDYLSHIAVGATEDLGFNAAMRAIDFNDPRTFHEGFDKKELIAQTLRHNPEKATTEEMEDFYKAKDGTIIRSIPEGKPPVLDAPGIINVVDSTGKSSLYMSVDFYSPNSDIIHSQYEPLGLLGTSYWQEYDITQRNPRSLIEENNVESAGSLPSFIAKPEPGGIIHEQSSSSLRRGVDTHMDHSEILHKMLDNIADHPEANSFSPEINPYNRELASIFSKLTMPEGISLKEGNAPSYDWSTNELTMTGADMGSTVSMVDNLLHEVSHVFSAKALYDHQNGGRKSKEAQAVVDFHGKIKELVQGMYSTEQIADFNEALHAYTTSDQHERPGIVDSLVEKGYERGAAEEMARTLYGVSSPAELVAMSLKDPVFQKALNNIPFKEDLGKSIWGHLRELLGDMLRALTGVHINKGSALEVALHKSMDLIQSEGSRRSPQRTGELTARKAEQDAAQSVENQQATEGRLSQRDASIPAQRELLRDGIITKSEDTGTLFMKTREKSHPDIPDKKILNQEHYDTSRNRIEAMSYPDGEPMFSISRYTPGGDDPVVTVNPDKRPVTEASKVAEFSMLKGMVTEKELFRHLRDIGILSGQKYTGEYILESKPRGGDNVTQRSIKEQNLAAITHINELYNGELFDVQPLKSGYRVRINEDALKQINQERGLSPGNKKDLGMEVSKFKYTLAPDQRSAFQLLRDSGRLKTKC